MTMMTQTKGNLAFKWDLQKFCQNKLFLMYKNQFNSHKYSTFFSFQVRSLTNAACAEKHSVKAQISLLIHESIPDSSPLRASCVTKHSREKLIWGDIKRRNTLIWDRLSIDPLNRWIALFKAILDFMLNLQNIRLKMYVRL